VRKGTVCVPDLTYAFDPAKMNPNTIEPFFYITAVNMKVSLKIVIDPERKRISVTDIEVKEYKPHK
jgi:hypothetical protein